MKRWLFNITAVFSLLLMLATVGLWVASWYSELHVGFFDSQIRGYGLWSNEGTVRLGCVDVIAVLKRRVPPGSVRLRYPYSEPEQWIVPGFGYCWPVPQPGLDDRNYSLTVPHWFLALIFATGPAVWLYKWNRPRKLGPNICRSCGYDLTGNETGQCPECGVDAKAPEASGFHSV